MMKARRMPLHELPDSIETDLEFLKLHSWKQSLFWMILLHANMPLHISTKPSDFLHETSGQAMTELLQEFAR
jgi:hypothetical protein